MILAHGLGGRSDLPVPLWLALYAGAAALIVSFVALTVLWTSPRLRGADGGIALPAAVQRFVDARVTRIALPVLGLAALATLLGTAWFGPSSAAENPAPTWFYVWFWVGLVPVSLLLGPIYRIANPLRALATLLARTERPIPERLGYAPAMAGMLAFLWLELVYPHSDSPHAVAIFVSTYAIVHLAAGTWYGPHWFDRADGFEVYFSLVARLSPLGRRSDGALVLRNPLDGLVSEASDGLTPVVLLVLGSTTFDGITRLPIWQDMRGNTFAGTVGLLGAIAAVGLAYAGAIWLTKPYVRAEHRTGIADTFAHSLIPIMIGYTVAHYFSFAIFQGQAGYLLIGDHGRIDYGIVSTTAIAWIQIGAIVAGHVVGVIAAHDRAVGILRPGYLKIGQYPMLALMVTYTAVGIELVSGG